MGRVDCLKQLSIALIVVGLIVSCTTFQTNSFIQKNLTQEEKAELIFQKGLTLYNTKLIEKNDLKAIPEVRSYFVAALRANPDHLRAQEYLVKTDTFKTSRLETYIKRARTLKDQKTRTDAEDYELVLAVKHAQEIDNLNGDVIKLWIDTGDVRKQVIQRRTNRLAELDISIRSAKTKTELNKQLVQVAKLMNEIANIDPNNRDALTAKKSIDEYVTSVVLVDTNDAAAKLSQKKYQDAELALINAEKTYGTLQKTPLPELSKVKYQLYFSWAESLYKEKKYQAAEARINTALQVEKTPEAAELKNKIAKGTGTVTTPPPAKKGTKTASQNTEPKRDYDAELTDLLVIIDATITRGDLVKAWDLVNANMVQLTIQSNKDKLASRKVTIMNKIKELYADSITAFNGEDYETARDGFKTIVRIDPGYEQAQAYLDRTNTKLRALSGDE
jgi:tetratricopeptide (TPR) repeat protein